MPVWHITFVMCSYVCAPFQKLAAQLGSAGAQQAGEVQWTRWVMFASAMNPKISDLQDQT